MKQHGEELPTSLPILILCSTDGIQPVLLPRDTDVISYVTIDRNAPIDYSELWFRCPVCREAVEIEAVPEIANAAILEGGTLQVAQAYATDEGIAA